MHQTVFKKFAFLIGGTLVGASVFQFSALAVLPWLQELRIISSGSHNRYISVAPNSSQWISIDDQLSAMLTAVNFEDVREMESAVHELASSAISSARDANLEALLLRYVSIDPHSAVQFALNEQLERRFVLNMWQAWADADAESAIAALSEIGNQELRRAIALDFVGLQVQGTEDIETFARGLGEGTSSGFAVDALARLASNDALNAFRQASSLDNFRTRLEALERIAIEWARKDAVSALNYVNEVENPLHRNMFHFSVVIEWLSWDPSNALNYVSSGEGRRLLSVISQDMLSVVAAKLAIHQPEEALLRTSTITGAVGQQLRSLLMGRIVERDLPRALTRLSELPAGNERRELAFLVGTAYAREDPELALAWARDDLDRATARVAKAAILQEIGLTDVKSAVDIALEAGINYSPNPSQIAELTGDEFLSIVDAILADSQFQPQMFNGLMESWPGNDSSMLWDWLLQKDNSGNEIVVQSVANAFANRDVLISVQSIYTLPERSRGTWVVSFASSYAQRDPEAAVDWLQEFQSEPLYSEWATDVANLLIQPSARGNPYLPVFPRPAAQIITSLREPPAEVVEGVARGWAANEPQEALQWAFDLPSEASRVTALSAGVGAWTVNDKAAAVRWAMSLPNNRSREMVLVSQMAQEIASHGTVSDHVISAFGQNDDLQAIMSENLSTYGRAFRWLGSRDSQAATQLLNRHISDGALNDALQAEIDRGSSLSRPMSRELLLSVTP